MRSTFGTISIHASELFVGIGVVGESSRIVWFNIYNILNKLVNYNFMLKTSKHARTCARKHTRERSHGIDDYIGLDERAGLVKSVLAKNGLSHGFVAYTDGSCWNLDPNRCGGSAYVVLDSCGNVFKATHKGFAGTSNNRMEMLAIISAVASVPQGSSIVVMTDSQYAIRAFTYGGSANNDLIELYNKFSASRDVSLEWVRGHNGTPLNEWCDHWAGVEYRATSEAVKNSKQNS